MYDTAYKRAVSKFSLAPQEAMIDYTDPMYGGVNTSLQSVPQLTMPGDVASGNSGYVQESIPADMLLALKEDKKDSEGSSSKDVAGAMAGAAGKGAGIEDIASTGLIASGNPYGMALGGALMGLSAVNKKKQQNAENRYLAAVRQQQAKQDAISKLASIGQHLTLG
jgi:hypothetical protein